MPDQKPPAHPRSERTIYPREHRRPLKGDSFAEAKEAEKHRKRVDPYYITAEEAQALPPEVATREAERIRYSQPDWPESRSVASRALGPLPPGAGETVVQRPVDAAGLFGGAAVPADPGAQEGDPG